MGRRGERHGGLPLLPVLLPELGQPSVLGTPHKSCCDVFFFFLENPTVQFSGNYPISVQIVPGNSNTGDDFTKITGGSGVGAGRRGEPASPQNSPERMERWSLLPVHLFKNARPPTPPYLILLGWGGGAGTSCSKDTDGFFLIRKVLSSWPRSEHTFL